MASQKRLLSDVFGSAVALILVAGVAAAANQPSAGSLLVASQRLNDPNFQRTVVLLIAHDPGGVVGVVLNRPSDTEVAAALPSFGAAVTAPAVVFVGGPVVPEGALVLGEVDEPDSEIGWRAVVGGIGLLDLNRIEGDGAGLPPAVRRARLFAGHAGWGAGRLEGEIAAGGWFVVEAAPDDVFTSDPGRLWGGVLRRQGGIFQTISEHPSSN